MRQKKVAAIIGALAVIAFFAQWTLFYVITCSGQKRTWTTNLITGTEVENAFILMNLIGS